MRIIQITDLHLSGPDDPEAEVDPWERWQTIAQALRNEKVDLLVNTGDICMNIPHKKIYQNFHHSLQSLDFPIIHLGGNHDDVPLMSEQLEGTLSSWTIKEWEGFSCIFLNTASNSVLERDIQKLRGLTQKADKPLLLFMHHPPLYAGCMHMDNNYPLQNIDEVWPILREANTSIEVFCGHYHIERTILSKNVQVHITPSPLFSIDPAFRKVRKSYQVPAVYRWIRLQEGELSQGLSFIGGESA